MKQRVRNETSVCLPWTRKESLYYRLKRDPAFLWGPVGPAGGWRQSETDSTCLASVHENSMRIPGHQREEEASEENENFKALYLVLKCGAITLLWFLYLGKLTFCLWWIYPDAPSKESLQWWSLSTEHVVFPKALSKDPSGRSRTRVVTSAPLPRQ